MTVALVQRKRHGLPPAPSPVRGPSVALGGVRDTRLGTPRFGIVAAATISAACIVASCGGTSPVAPTGASSAVQYPSLAGHYLDEALSELRLQYQDTGLTTGWFCDTDVWVDSQSDGTFSGGFRSTGGGSREPPCTFSSTFTAQIRPDGTITSFRMDYPLFAGACTPSSDTIINGTATHSEIRIVMTDRATCLDWRVVRRDLVPRQDTYRLVTISVKRLYG